MHLLFTGLIVGILVGAFVVEIIHIKKEWKKFEKTINRVTVDQQIEEMEKYDWYN